MSVPKLDNAPRCEHTKMNGQPCAAPARRGQQYCIFHANAHGTPDRTIRMIEDGMSLQYAIFQVVRLLWHNEIDHKRASLMLYALQIASSNLKRLGEESQAVEYAQDHEKEKSFLQEFVELLKLSPEDGEQLMESYDKAARGEECEAPDIIPGAMGIPDCVVAECRRTGEPVPVEEFEAAVAEAQKERAERKKQSLSGVNIKACADRRYRKPITENRKSKITNHNSQIADEFFPLKTELGRGARRISP